jgi:hypothetical protein
MPFNPRDVALIASGSAFALLILFIAWNESGDSRAPRYETNDNPNLGYVIDELDTGNHYFHPLMCIPGQKVVFTRHRYPTQAGINTTVLLNHGLDALRNPSPQDDDWRVRPPGEVMWLCAHAMGAMKNLAG